MACPSPLAVWLMCAACGSPGVVVGSGNATAAGNATAGNSTSGTNSTTRGHSFNVTLDANNTLVVSVSTSSGNLTVQTANTTVPSRVLRTDAGAWRGGEGSWAGLVMAGWCKLGAAQRWAVSVHM